MDRLTVNSEILDGRYELKCLCNDVVPEYKGNCRDYCEINADCEYCGIRQAFDRLAAYEDTGLSPGEITAMKADNEILHKLFDTVQTLLWSDTEEEE